MHDFDHIAKSAHIPLRQNGTPYGFHFPNAQEAFRNKWCRIHAWKVHRKAYKLREEEVIYMNDKEKENQLTEEDLHKVSGGATKFKTANMMWVDRSNYEDFLTRTPRAILMAGKMWGWDSQQQANVLEEYAGTDSKVTIGVLDVDEHERFSHRLHIEWTPTVIYYLNGVETGRDEGFQPLSKFTGK